MSKDQVNALRISIPHDLSGANDDDKIDLLVGEIIQTLEDVSEVCGPSASEVISAAFTVVDKLLRGARRVSTTPKPDSDEVRRVLMDMTIEFGRVPS